MKVKRIELEGFKQFERLDIACREVNVFVGPNNAGKSTVLDALRICSDVLRFSRRQRPQIVGHEDLGVCATYYIDHSSISVPLANVTRNYRDDRAKIRIVAENDNRLEISLTHDGQVEAALVTQGQLPRTAQGFRGQFPVKIVVVPTLGPFEAEEPYVVDSTVRRNENTRLAHRNFRNILLRKEESEFLEFKNLVESTWGGISLSSPEHRHVDGIVDMFFEEDRITREVAWVGYGFQIWLQLMLQMMRGDDRSILVLDEPDIYLHADLQHKLFRLSVSQFDQVFMATHSTEIINEANPGDILSLVKGAKSARRVTNEDSYRNLFSILGSSENAEFARIARARRIMFFEGKDRKILKRIASKIDNIGVLDDTDTVYLQAGGFSQWRRVVDADWAIQNMFQMRARIAAVFDRDYLNDEQVREFIQKVESERVICRVLLRKELENYLLIPATLHRAIERRLDERGHIYNESQVDAMLDEIAEEFKSNVLTQAAAQALAYKRERDPGEDDSTTMARSMERFEAKWTNLEAKFCLVPGKEYLSRLSAQLQRRFGASITTSQILAAMRVGDVPDDIARMLREIDAFLSVAEP